MSGPRTPADSADVCIIGSGPAGAILAAGLAERGHAVVVLEAGPRFDDADRSRRMERALRPPYTIPDVWDMGGPRDDFSASGSVEYDLNIARVKGVGGTTLHWGALTPRLHPEDFEMWTRHGVGDDWPISYDDLEPYYLDAEHEMGVAGEPNRFAGPRSGPFPLPPVPASYTDSLFEAAFENQGIELHSVPRAIATEPYDGRGPCVGYGTCNPVCPSGAKYEASVHVRKAETAGARVIDRVPVSRLVVDESGERIREAIYHTPSERQHAQRASYFVVACGGIESPRLLLQSSSDHHPEGLANTSGLVGRCFMEHPGITVTGTLAEPTRQHLIGYETSQTEQFYDHDAGPEGSMILQISTTAGPTPVEVALEPRAPRSGQLLDGDVREVLQGDEWGDALLDRIRDRTSGRVALKAWVEQLPDPANRIELDRSTTDDLGNPVPDIDLEVDDRTRRSLQGAERILHEVFAEMGAEDVRTEFGPSGPWFAKHHLGTTRMGTDPDTSVVDPMLRTHDVSNLYVCSSSAFVTGGAANPTLTIAALSLRLADHLHERLS